MKTAIAYDGSERADSALDNLTYAGLPAEGIGMVLGLPLLSTIIAVSNSRK